MVMPMLRAREISYRANDAECKLIISDAQSIDEVRKSQPKLETVKKILVADGEDAEFVSFESRYARESDYIKPETTNRDDLALIAYTSGSTGDAKGTVHFHGDVLAIADGYAKNILHPTENDVFGGNPSLAFTFG